MKTDISWQEAQGWLLIVGIIGFGALGVWYLVGTKSGGAEDPAESLAVDKTGATVKAWPDDKDYDTAYTMNETAVFEVLLVLRDQTDPNPEEDTRSSLKRGDVLAVRKSPHLWSDTERTSYLVVKMKMTGQEANALLAPKYDGDTIVLARATRIDLDRIGFAGDQVANGQPLGEKVFDTSVIQEK